MAIPMNTALFPVQSIHAFSGSTFRIISGSNLGGPLSADGDLVPGDVFALTENAECARLAVSTLPNGGIAVGDGTELGRPGTTLRPDCVLSLVSLEGQLAEILVIVELARDGTVADTFLHPISDFHTKSGYTLISVNHDTANRKFGQLATASFARGTCITMATGACTPIEKLRVGARVLTHDAGPQTVRWIGHCTVRASGAFAPIVIRAGTLNNPRDLIVSPEHRLYIHRNPGKTKSDQSDLVVKARHIVNGDTIYVQDGGFVDCFQILFDRHHIVQAEGVAAESMLMEPRVRPALPPELLERLFPLLPGDSRQTAHVLDVQNALLQRSDAIDLLRRASAPCASANSSRS